MSQERDWQRDENTWPQKRDFKTFKEWFEVEVHSVVLDTVGGEIFDDEIYPTLLNPVNQ
jgi:hypothetical protein